MDWPLPAKQVQLLSEFGSFHADPIEGHEPFTGTERSRRGNVAGRGGILCCENLLSEFESRTDGPNAKRTVLAVPRCRLPPAIAMPQHDIGEM